MIKTKSTSHCKSVFSSKDLAKMKQKPVERGRRQKEMFFFFFHFRANLVPARQNCIRLPSFLPKSYVLRTMDKNLFFYDSIKNKNLFFFFFASEGSLPRLIAGHKKKIISGVMIEALTAKQHSSLSPSKTMMMRRTIEANAAWPTVTIFLRQNSKYKNAFLVMKSRVVCPQKCARAKFLSYSFIVTTSELRRQ